jgi:hypothetical protein
MNVRVCLEKVGTNFVRHVTSYSIAFNLDYFENAEQEDRYHAIKAR